jgi:hypothetical protein
MPPSGRGSQRQTTAPPQDDELFVARYKADGSLDPSFGNGGR